jgi:hypothetical protein
MTYWHIPILAVAISSISACEISQTGAAAHSTQTRDLAQDAPDGAVPGTCWGKTISPAIIETVTREVLLKPAQSSADGLIQKPAVYRKKDQQEIVKPRQETWFETVCPSLLTPDFVLSLQRSLSLRGAYKGNISGVMDEQTRQAIRKFQLSDGFDSGNLTVATARVLGLVIVSRPLG